MKEKLVLSKAERESPLWQRIEEHLNNRLISHRNKNDNNLGDVDTAKLRGRIAEAKALLALGDEPKIVETQDFSAP